MTEHRTKVSVVIPTFNRAHFLRAAIDSVLAQTRSCDEIIVIDDGSTDDTAAVVQQYGGGVRYACQENRGVGAARNHGLRLACGDYVAFLDSDDLWQPFKLALQVALLEALPDVAFLFTEFTVLKDDGSVTHQGSRQWISGDVEWARHYERALEFRELGLVVEGAPNDFTIYTGRMFEQLLNNALVLPTTAIVRRAVLDEETKFTESVAIFEDWEFFARLARRHSGAFVDVETAIQRGHGGPERVTRQSRLAKAQCYLGMVDRVWGSDAAFRSTKDAAVRSAQGRALLAVAREALLASEVGTARAALARWRRLGAGERVGKAQLYSLCAAVPAGPTLLRQILHAQTAWRVVSGRSDHGRHSVNPAA